MSEMKATSQHLGGGLKINLAVKSRAGRGYQSFRSERILLFSQLAVNSAQL